MARILKNSKNTKSKILSQNEQFWEQGCKNKIRYSGYAPIN